MKALGWNERIGYLFGAVYVLVGAVGFAVTSGVGFFENTGKDLIFFEINPFHNVIHLLVGAALIGAARASEASAKLMNGLVGGVYLVVAIVGTIIVEMDVAPGLIAGRSDANILALNHPDNLLHLASAAVLLGTSVFAPRKAARGDEVAEAEPEAVAEAEDEGDGGETEVEATDRPAAARDAGDAAPRTGTYRCVCGNFVVGIKQGRELPECPEPVEEEHYYMLQRAHRTPNPKSKTRSKSKPKAKSRPKSRTTQARRTSASSRGSRR